MKKISTLILFTTIVFIAFGQAKKKVVTKKVVKPKIAAVAPSTPQVQYNDKTLAIGSAFENPAIVFQAINNTSVPFESVKTDKGVLLIFIDYTCRTSVINVKAIDSSAQKAEKLGYGVAYIFEFDPKNEDFMYKVFDKGVFNEMKIGPAKRDNHYYLLDAGSELKRTMNITNLPYLFLFNDKNLLVYKGGVSDNQLNPEKAKNYYLINALNAIETKKQIIPNSTQPGDCTVNIQ